MAKCIACGAENPAGEKFCSECGMRLPVESMGGAPTASAVASEANGEQLAAYKKEAMLVLKAGAVNLMSRRKLKMLQKQHGLTDAQAQEIEKEILAEIERVKAEEQERAAEEEAKRESERRAAESDCDDEADEDDDVEDDGSEEDDDADASEDEGSDDSEDSDEEDISSSGSYSVILKVAAENKGPMLRDLVTITGKRLWPDISDMVENLPAVVAKGISHDEAKKYAVALMLDGAEAEVVVDDDKVDDDGADEEDVETSSSALCSIVVKGCNKSRLDNLIIELNKFDDVPSAYDTRQMLCNPPGTLANNISHETAKKIGAVLEQFGCDYEIVAKEQGDGDVDFVAIVDYIKSFKKSTGCDDIVLPGSSSFDKKWTNLSTVLENSFDDLSLDQDDAFAILDCTVFGSAKNGVLIDRTGIYTNNDDAAFSGWMDWNDFKANGSVEKIGSYDVQVYDEPDFNFGVNVSGCSLSQDNAVRFFRGLLALVRGEEA